MTSKTNTLSKNLPSTRAGFTWNLYTFKPYERSHAPYVTAVEGVAVSREYDGKPYTSFQTLIPGARNTDKMLIPGGRMTQKAQATAMAELEKQMREMGLIAEGDIQYQTSDEADILLGLKTAPKEVA